MAARVLNKNFSEIGQPCLDLGKDETNSKYLIFKKDSRKDELFHLSNTRVKI